MRETRLIVLAVVIWAVVQPAFAGEILFSTESPLLYGPEDEEVLIRLDVKNTLGEDTLGSFTWTVRDRDDPDTRSFTDRRVIFSDQEYTEFGVHPGEGHDYLVDVTFDYPDGDDPDTVYHVALEGIHLRFEEDPGGSDAAGTLESVQIKVTKGASQEQAGAPQGGSSDRVPQVRSSPDDIESLSRLLEEETLALSEKKERLKGRVLQSELYISVDELLENAGFTPGDLGVTLGQGVYNDEFGMNFVNESGTEIRVSGELAEDEVLSITVEAPGRLPPVYGIDRNETYLSLDSNLRNEGYAVLRSLMNITPKGAAITIDYEKASMTKVMNITVRNGEPVDVVLEDPDGGLHFILPLVVLAVTAFSAFLLYRYYLKYCRRTGQGEGASTDAGRGSCSPLALLEESYGNYMNGELKEAFSTAGRALRLHIALRYDGRENSTNLQALLLLKAGKDPGYGACADILSVCDAAVYGKSEPDNEVFAGQYRRIRAILDEDPTPGQGTD
ncbi:MAG TPA: hypothetical protein PLG75_03315 [Methanoculleus sp.]|mgnify:CR=1 FL=1|nr:hypothetical protein [Methanoculleus sp.]